MKRATLLCIALAVIVALGIATAAAIGAGAGGQARASSPADTVYTNGVVYTVDASHSVAQAVAVKDGRIVYVGDDAGAQAYVGAGTTSVDLGGKFVMPGFIDSHAHASYAYQDLYAVSLYGLKSMKAYQAKLTRFAAKHPDLPTIQGMGWSNTLNPGIGPTKRQLDAAVKGRPAAITSEDGHSLWCNSAALKLAGITAKTPNPPGGIIERFPGTRTPSGTLREAAADLVASKLPDYTVAQYENGLLHFDRDIAAPLGITSVMDPMLDIGSNKLPAYEQLAQLGKLTVRFRAALHLDPSYGAIDQQIQDCVAERAKHTTDAFQTPFVKFFADGVVEGHTAYLDQPYKNTPRYTGIPVWRWSALETAAADAAKAGFTLHFHAIGDAATSMSLNAIAAAERATGTVDARDAITHLQLVTPTDYVRMAQLKVVAVPDPYWFVKDNYYYDLQLPYLGKWRAQHEYPMKSFFDNGLLVASASDYPVTIPNNPLMGIETGVLRWFQGGSEWAKKGDILWKAQRVTRQQMIDSFTINGAKANWLEAETGSLEVGKSADMIVLNRDIVSCPVRQIGTTKVLETIFQGEKVYPGT